MFVVILTSILGLSFAILDSAKILKSGLKYGFIVVTVIACLRYDYGNDYMSYMYEFDSASKYSLSFIFANHESLQYQDSLFKDIGAVVLYKLFNPLGFYLFAAFISALGGYIYWQFIIENVRREYYWIAMFLYLFQFEFYLLPMSMIRQGLCIALLVYSWHYIKNGKIIIPVIIILICISIHKSSVIVIPFLIFSYFKINNGKLISIILLSATVVAFASSSLINHIFESVSSADVFKIYIDSYKDEQSNGMGIIRKILAFLPFILAVNYIRQEKFSSRSKTLMFLSTIGVILLPFTSIIALISRLCYYFNIFTIVAIPLSLKGIHNNVVRYSVCTLILASTFYQYIDIFLNSVYTANFMEYKTIFLAD